MVHRWQFGAEILGCNELGGLLLLLTPSRAFQQRRGRHRDRVQSLIYRCTRSSNKVTSISGHVRQKFDNSASELRFTGGSIVLSKLPNQVIPTSSCMCSHEDDIL